MERASAVLVVGLLLVACGEPYATSEVDADLPWHADPRPRAREWGLSRKEYTRLVLPEAAHASADRQGPYARLVANLLADGHLLFKGSVWTLTAPTEGERNAALAACAEEMALLLDAPELPDGEGGTRVPLLFHVDRTTAWQHVRTLWTLVVDDPEIRMRSFEWAVWSPYRLRGRDAIQEAELREEEAPDDALPVALTAVDGMAWPTIELAVGGRAWSFGELVETPWEDAEFLAQVNQAWSEAEALLAEHAASAPARPVALRIATEEQELPWAFVVKVFDLLIGAGLTDVYLVEEGWHLALEVPREETTPLLEDAPVVTPLVLLGCALAIALAFWIAFRPLRRPRKA